MKTPFNFCFERWNSTNRTVPESFHPIYRERQRYGDPYRLPVHDGGRRQHPSSFGEPHQGPSMCAGRRQNPLRAIVDRQRMPVAYGGTHRRCRHWAYYWSSEASRPLVYFLHSDALLIPITRRTRFGIDERIKCWPRRVSPCSYRSSSPTYACIYPLHPRLYAVAHEICHPVVDLKGNRTWSLGICDAPGPAAQITTHGRVKPAK